MRTIEEIQADMDSVQATFPALTGVDTTSDAGLFKQLRGLFALFVQMLETSWDKFRQNLETDLSKSKVGNISWYVRQAKLFQYGDAIAIINGQVGYLTVDPNKNIISQATMSEDMASGKLSLRIAKKENNRMVPLTENELTAVKEYMSKVKFAGVLLDVLSLEADQVRLVASVKVDRQIMALTGTLLSNSTKAPVVEAINTYLSTLPEESIISNSALTDAIRKIPGVKDCTVTQSFSRRPTAPNWSAYQGEVLADAGYAILHADSVITYTY